jgi:hypothetical protein
VSVSIVRRLEYVLSVRMMIVYYKAHVMHSRIIQGNMLEISILEYVNYAKLGNIMENQIKKHVLHALKDVNHVIKINMIYLKMMRHKKNMTIYLQMKDPHMMIKSKSN